MGSAVLAAGVLAFYIYYHPPMRLMPAPLLFQGDDIPLADIAPALTEGSMIDVFYGSNRFPVGSPDARIYSVAPDTRLHLGRAELRIGDESSTLAQLYEWTTGVERDDRPFVHLERMREYASLSIADEPEGANEPAAAAWFEEINASLAASPHKNVLVYIHGANTTVERAAGQAAMLRHFTGRNAVVVVFVWPTAENFLRYSRDIKNAYGSAPRVVELITLLAEHTDAENIDVFTYSAGGTVGSDALGQLPHVAPAAAERLGHIIHAAPDADQRKFIDDLASYGPSANRVTALVNMRDSALLLSATVHRGARAGRPVMPELTEEASLRLLEAAREHRVNLVQIHPDNLAQTAATSHTFWYEDPWVGNDVIVSLLFGDLGPEQRQLVSGEAESGTRYWTIPQDYPDRLDALKEVIRAELTDRAQ
ncbi:MAG: alpha/beta hydrolase [Gammaproteobacteria bacterium]|nr:MAG: alpha/beta hydrolase [Gammaproteobacteria bacterium]